jgi:hypothetical protein
MCKHCEGHSDEVCDCGCDGSCDCGCHGGGFERRYQTKAEQIAELEAYLSELRTEVQAVEEHLADLKK